MIQYSSQAYQVLESNIQVPNPYIHTNNVKIKISLWKSISELTISKSVISIARIQNINLKHQLITIHENLKPNRIIGE